MSNTVSKVIRVVIADDHPIVRSGIHNELSNHADIQIVGEATNGDQALQLAASLQPDILLLDINMPGLRVVEVVKRLRELPTAPRVIILTVLEDEEHMISLLSAGAKGYILKDEQPAVITGAVRAVDQGALWLSARVACVIGQGGNNSADETPEKTLTPRELEVLRMMARGWGNSRIAQHMCVTEATIKFHVGNIYDKLSVTSRVEAVLYAAQRSLVNLNTESS
jgi:two-component system, NarL family, response regulator LiaR